MSISVGLPVAVNIAVPASLVGFQQFRAIQHFCVEGSNKRSDRGHSRNDLEFFTNRTFRGSLLGFWQIDLTLSVFYLQKWERGPHKWISLGPRIS